jgi:predicted TIM-barrel fold metal-dependent hydrolase
MVEITRRVGIDCTAIMSWAGPLSVDTDLGNEVVADAVRRYPDEFVGLATVNPEHQTEEEIEAVIRTYHVGLKFPGLKTFTPAQNLDYDDPAFDRWFGFADRHGLYAVIDPGGATPGEQVAALARKFPNMGIHLDHCGKSWDYAKAAVGLALEFGNIWAQINFTAVTNGVVEYLVDRLGAERVLFGSDAPMRDPRPQAAWLTFTRLAEAEKRRIFGGNFQGILRRAQAALSALSA